MENVISRLRHPKEKLYGTMMYVFGALGWGAIIAVVVALLASETDEKILVVFVEFGLFAAIYWISMIFYRAHIYGHYVLLGNNQFPELAEMVREGAAALGMAHAPQAFIYNSNGVMNAFATRLFGRPYVLLTSALIDADHDEQVRFVIGHELAHHAAGHLSFWKNLAKFPAHIVPFLPQAYSRARELTCDRTGAFLAKNLDASRSALQMLACGSARLNDSMNRTAFEAQEQLVPPISGFIKHIFSHYPRHTARVRALSIYFAQPAE